MRLKRCLRVCRDAVPGRNLARYIPSAVAIAAFAVAPASATQAMVDTRTDEVIVVFISSSYCIANQHPEFLEAVHQMLPTLRAASEDVQVVGVSIDVEAADGVAYLQQFGAFDEIIAGRSWLNTAVVEYVWRGAIGVPTIPQVLVLERSIDRSSRSISVGPDRKLIQLIGGDEIEDWVSRGAPIR